MAKTKTMWYRAYIRDVEGGVRDLVDDDSKRGYVRDKDKLPKRFQLAVALLDAADKDDDGDAFIDGVGEVIVYGVSRETDYYILKSFLEAQDERVDVVHGV